MSVDLVKRSLLLVRYGAMEMTTIIIIISMTDMIMIRRADVHACACVLVCFRYVERIVSK